MSPNVIDSISKPSIETIENSMTVSMSEVTRTLTLTYTRIITHSIQMTTPTSMFTATAIQITDRLGPQLPVIDDTDVVTLD